MQISTHDTLNQIDSVIAQNSILKHPFYQAWQRGELTREALQDYASQYYHHVAAFPTYLSALHSHTSDIATRQAILENLIDEERGAENHPELWLRFADAVGAERNAVLTSEVKPETQNLISEFKDICSNGTVTEGLSALYSYESQIPDVSATKIAGLIEFYGINSEGGLKYFTVHQEADIKHSADERSMLREHIAQDGAGDSVTAAERVTTALWGVLTGVCERHQITCN